MTVQLIQVVSFAAGLLAFSALIVFCLITWYRGITGKALLLAALLTLCFILMLGFTGESPLTRALGYLMLFSWFGLLIRAIGLDRANFRSRELRAVSALAAGGCLLTALGCTVALNLTTVGESLSRNLLELSFIIEILLSVCGLVAIEQLVRNTREDLRWRLRYLNIGVGLLFTYSLLQGATGLLFGGRLSVLTILQPAIGALAVPLIMIASVRNRENQLRLNVSRQFVFRSGVLIATGALLLVMGLTGYYVQLTGGQIMTAAIILLATVTFLAVFIVIGSTGFQIRVRRLIARHFYDNRHDYRERWASVTEQLTEPNPDFTLEEQAVRALLGVFESSGGAYWRLNGNSFLLEAALHARWQGPLSPSASAALLRCFDREEHVIDLEAPVDDGQWALRDELDLNSLDGLRFILPLFAHSELIGMIGVKNPPTSYMLMVEDYDIIRLVSREVAGFLALRTADEALSESRQFDAMNRLTTFLIHDVKTISAQLSLLSQNADKHKNNPAFVSDMIETVRNADERLRKLIYQINHSEIQKAEPVVMRDLLPGVLERFTDACPRPQLQSYNPESSTYGNRDRLMNVIGHVLQNAIDATDEDGQVSLRAETTPPWLELVIEDSGIGMSRDFIDQELFTPFKSTKGVAGMGIGAYQVRDYVRSLGGDVLVESRPGSGTSFTLRLPLIDR